MLSNNILIIDRSYEVGAGKYRNFTIVNDY